jgi:hypothetical protein
MFSTAEWDVYILSTAYVPPSNSPPYFDVDPDATLEVECNKKKDYALPSIVDDEIDGVTVVLKTDQAVASLATLSTDFSMINFNPLCRANLTSVITLKLTDDNIVGP